MIQYAALPMRAAPPTTLHITMAAISPSLSPPDDAVVVSSALAVVAAAKKS